MSKLLQNLDYGALHLVVDNHDTMSSPIKITIVHSIYYTYNSAETFWDDSLNLLSLTVFRFSSRIV